MLLLDNTTGRRTPIGLDIGRTGVRAAQLRQSGNRYRLTAASVVEGPPPAAAGGAEHLGDRLRECLSATAFRGRTVVTALAPPEVEFHVLELPGAALRADEAGAAEMVHWEIGRLMNTATESVETRHWLLPPTTAPAPNAIGVAASREAVDRTLAACQQAGLNCSQLDTTATALGRFGCLLRAWPAEQVWGLLDLADRQSRVVLCIGDTPVLVRNAATGSAAWTKRIAEALQLSAKAAETHKRNHGIALAGRDRSAADDETRTPARSELASLLLGALRGDLNDLAAEVKRSYEYVLSCYPGRRAADLVLVGGGAALRNLPEFLSRSLGIPVRRASAYLGEPSCRLQLGTSGRNPLEELAAAVGLAVGR